MAFTWMAVESLTGDVIDELPNLTCSQVKQTIGKYETANASLPLPGAPNDWQRATLQYASALILLDDNTPDKTLNPVWGGLVTKRTRNQTDTVSLSLATAEAYTDKRYVGDQTYTQVGQCAIAKDVIEKYVLTGSNGGLPGRVVIVGSDTHLRDRTYADDDDKTVYAILQELAGVIDGIEWTVGWEHQTDPERYTPVFYVGDRLGSAVQDGFEPGAVFEIPGPLVNVELVEDWTGDNAANDVMASSTAIADVRPESTHVVTADPQRPTLEYRFTPSTSITVTDTLDEHAQAKAAVLKSGLNQLSFTANVLNAPVYGADWFIGDDIGYRIADTVPAFPGGMEGTVRSYGFQYDQGAVNKITPVLNAGG